MVEYSLSHSSHMYFEAERMVEYSLNHSSHMYF